MRSQLLRVQKVHLARIHRRTPVTSGPITLVVCNFRGCTATQWAKGNSSSGSAPNTPARCAPPPANGLSIAEIVGASRCR